MRRPSAGAPDGWLALVQRVPLAGLLADLPRGGLGSVTLAVDPKAVRKSDAGPILDAFYTKLAGGCADLGLSLEQQVLQRLEGVAGVQLVVMPKQQVGTAWMAKARSERDAHKIFAECRRVLGSRGTDAVQAHQAGEELLLPASPFLPQRGSLGIVRDSVVLGTSRGVVEQVALADRSADPKWVAPALKNLPGAARQSIAGVVLVDLSPLLAGGEGEGAALRQHAGYLRVQPDHIRLELFSQL